MKAVVFTIVDAVELLLVHVNLFRFFDNLSWKQKWTAESWTDPKYELPSHPGSCYIMRKCEIIITSFTIWFTICRTARLKGLSKASPLRERRSCLSNCLGGFKSGHKNGPSSLRCKCDIHGRRPAGYSKNVLELIEVTIKTQRNRMN